MRNLLVALAFSSSLVLTLPPCSDGDSKHSDGLTTVIPLTRDPLTELPFHSPLPPSFVTREMILRSAVRDWPALSEEEFLAYSNDLCSLAVVNIGYYFGGHDFDQNPLGEQEILDKVISLTRGYVADISKLRGPEPIATRAKSLMAEIGDATFDWEKIGYDLLFALEGDPF